PDRLPPRAITRGASIQPQGPFPGKEGACGGAGAPLSVFWPPPPSFSFCEGASDLVGAELFCPPQPAISTRTRVDRVTARTLPIMITATAPQRMWKLAFRSTATKEARPE